MNLTFVFVLQALNHNRHSMDMSRQRPRRISSRATAMIMPVLSSGTSCSRAYAVAAQHPSEANRSFSDNGTSWMPLWRTPLLRPLVSSPGPPCCSRTRRRIGAARRRRISASAIAHPTIPAPTMQTSYVFIDSRPLRTRPNRARSDGQCEHTNPEDPDARRLSDKYGKILFVFCGGGCKAVIQATTATELVRAGLVPSHIMSSSAGTCNALGFVEHPGIVGAEKTLRIWENYITSPEAIYEVHPFIREKLTSLVGVVPQLAQDWGPNRSILRDVRRATRFLPLVMSLGVRMPLRMAGRAVSFLFRLMDIFETQPKSFRYLAQAQAKERGVNLFIVRPDKSLQDSACWRSTRKSSMW